MEEPYGIEATAAIRLFEDDLDLTSPRKRRKYVPGGPGGGGRFLASEKTTSRRGALAGGSTPRRGRPPSRTPGAIAARLRRERLRQEKPTFDSAADAAAAAAVQIDGYKPREERGWEEFHPDLDVEMKINVFSANEVDGVRAGPINIYSASDRSGSFEGLADNTSCGNAIEAAPTEAGTIEITPVPKRRPGRPPRRPESMLSGLGSPPAPKIVPIPTHNPRERLNLPKPNSRKVDPFELYETDQNVQVNFVDKSLAHVGYQESDIHARPGRTFVRLMENTSEDEDEVELVLEGDGEEALAAAPVPAVGTVEYDMDEQDSQWLEAFNIHRKSEDVEAIKPAIFEITITQIEKEWHALEKRIPKPNPKPPQTHRPRSGSAAAVNGEPAVAGEEQDSKCAICDDGDCENTNAIVFCDGCDLAVHQECYGVPFIPEGQWLCRKCQLVGRNTATCIFCPNTDGAFKLTTESRWAHLICAIWIPEVSLGNTTFMEPVMDVAKVPKQRWKLTCYICDQKMGACVQCGNRNCFQAFHVTCARRAKLFLKMKSSHGGPAAVDASVLKALCDKHVPAEWRREHNVDEAIAEAKHFYHHAMKGKKWADSQQSALAMISSQPVETVEMAEPVQKVDDGQPSTAAQRRKLQQAQKNVWRLPSGAPIVPTVVFNTVELALQRFGIRKRKEYVAEACKYWTLKREARRGAALLKRLQLQMKTFTSSEITRRDFAAMGSSGQPKLERRIDFAETLLQHMSKLKQLCHHVKERQEKWLVDVQILEEFVDTRYTPWIPLIRPVLEKAQVLDTKGMFAKELRLVQRKVETRSYASAEAFGQDFSLCFQPAIELDPEGGLSAEQKDKKKLAKRILKAVQLPLAEALRNEADLTGLPFEDKLAQLTMIFNDTKTSNLDAANDDSVVNARSRMNSSSSEGSIACLRNGTAPGLEDRRVSMDVVSVTAGFLSDKSHDTLVSPESMSDMTEPERSDMKSERPRNNSRPSPAAEASMTRQLNDNGLLNEHSDSMAKAPMTPPRSEKSLGMVEHLQGGIPRYAEAFDTDGTTIYDERWTGPQVLRDMSEELSEIDDEELRGMGEEIDGANNEDNEAANIAAAEAAAAKKLAAAKRRKRDRNRY